MFEPSNTVILFGSTARGDNDEKSDVDILILKDFGYPESIKKDCVEIQVHTKLTMLKKARDGDLFAMHIAIDGVVLSDPSHFFTLFKEACRFKKSYHNERREAYILGGFLLRSWRNFKSVSFLNKRIAWCVRSILISRAADEGRLIFSPAGLREYAKPFDIEPLLRLRRSEEAPEPYLPMFHNFIQIYGGSEYIGKSIAEYTKLINGLGNSVARSTYLKMLSDGDGLSY